MRKKLIRFLKISGFIFIFLVILFFLLNWIFPLPDKIDYSTVITDNKGQVINAFLTRDQQWRMKTELDEISPLLQKTIIAKEDRHFYTHPGVNPLAVIRALFNNILGRRRTSGASTITMQVAKALSPGKRNLGNKMREMFRAFQLELRYSKKEILQMYLNLVPYGGNIQGVKAASLLYFNKNPDHLSLAEITALSIIPNKPAHLILGKNNDAIVIERNRWLKIFAERKVFTNNEIQDALAEPLTVVRHSVPHFLPHLSNRLHKIRSVSAPPEIHTTINLNMQLNTEKLVADYIRVQRLSDIRNAAIIIIDNKTHEILTYVGSADFNDTTDGSQVNGAAAIRQPGSTLKPLLYAACFDDGLLTPKSVITDVPVNYQGYTPENYDEKFNGFVTMEYALEHSLNIPAVKALNMFGPENFISKLSAANFQQIKKDQRKLGLSMILGGCGTTLEELSALFSAFANNGMFINPTFLKTNRPRKPFELISPASAYMINEILSKVNRPDFPINWSVTEHMPKIAWKTGTSYGRKDAWSIGYNRKYTVGVWTGNFSGLGVPTLSGANTATPLLFRVFNTIDYDSDEQWFSQPQELSIRKVCSETGLPPTEHCSSLTTDYFIPLISTTKSCDNRQELLINPKETVSYCKNCAPTTGYKKKFYKIIPPEIQAWYVENGIAFEKVPPHNPDCDVVFKGSAPSIAAPVNGTEYLVNKTNPEPLQLICKTANDVSRVYWYINNKFFKSSSPGEKQFFIPDEGPVLISCSDDKGRNRTIRITVKYVLL